MEKKKTTTKIATTKMTTKIATTGDRNNFKLKNKSNKLKRVEWKGNEFRTHKSLTASREPFPSINATVGEGHQWHRFEVIVQRLF